MPIHELKKIFLVMKLVVILLVVFAMNLSASVYSQNNKFDISLKKVSLKEVFKEIMLQSDYCFMYNNEDVSEIKDLSINQNDVLLKQILDVVFKGTQLTYVIKDNVIVVKKKSTEEQLSPIMQIKTRVLKGTVKDKDGNLLPGVSVVVKGTQSGVATDIDGKFEIKVDDKPGVILVLSFVGMKTKEVKVGNKTMINVVLEPDTENLEEVVVTGFQTISKERATGAFDKVDSEQINKPSSSISERLVGMISGVQTTVDAEGNVDFEIRGQTSLLADAQPLVVVDGFPIEGDFSSINPNDVESVTILKDAAASSIWGAKSANGVIVITTKKGQKGKTKVEVSSFVKFGNKLDLDYVNPMASSAEVIAYEKKGFASDFFGGPWAPASFNISNVTSGYSQAVTAMNEHRLGRISENEMNSILDRLSKQNNKSQIEKYLLNAPFTQQHNINISGGTDNISNVLSLMYENSTNYYKGNNVNKFMVNYRNEIKVTKWLNFDFSGMMQYNINNHDGVSIGDISNLAPYDMLVNSDGSLADLSNTYFYLPILNELVPIDAFPYSDWSYNPITEYKNRDLVRTDLNARIMTGLKLKIIEGLDFTTKLQYQLFTTKNKDYYSDKTFSVRKMVNTTSKWDQNYNTVPVANLPLGGILEMNNTTVKSYNFRNQINFVRTFAEKHSINFVAGSELSSRVYEYTKNPRSYGYDDDRLTVGEFPNGTENLIGWEGYKLYYWDVDLGYTNSFKYQTDRYFSLYGNLAYTFDDKYTFTGSLRTDASNLITDDPSYRYSPFWSAGMGWQIGKEEFMGTIDWLDRLNVRLTYGCGGNVDKSTSFKPLISVNGTSNRYTKEITASISSYGNPTLRWEKTQSVDLGFDFSVLRGKLYGNIDFYNKKSSDLIVDQTIASIHGTTSQKLNNGEMVNKGVELNLGTTIPLQGNDIIWSSNINFAYNKNKITSLYKAKYAMYDLYDGGTYAYVEGYNANTLWSLRYAGMHNFGTEADPSWGPSFHGVDGDRYGFRSWPPGVDAREYESNEGTTVAPYIVGFKNSFKIYDFNLSFLFTGKFGHVFRRQSFNYPAMTGGNTNINDKYAEVANDNGSKYPSIPDNEYRYYFWDRFYPYMDFLTENASHIRFQEVNLTYAFPRKILNRIGLKALSVYAQANNIGTILFNDYNEDPEYPKGTMKPQTTYVLGIKFNL